MPSWFMAKPSHTPMTLNSSGTPPACHTPYFTCWAMVLRCMCPGINSLYELAIPIRAARSHPGLPRARAAANGAGRERGRNRHSGWCSSRRTPWKVTDATGLHFTRFREGWESTAPGGAAAAVGSDRTRRRGDTGLPAADAASPAAAPRPFGRLCNVATPRALVVRSKCHWRRWPAAATDRGPSGEDGGVMTNGELSALRAQVVPRGAPTTAPVFIARARNATITDVEGREYIDFAAGIGVMTVGHGHPKVVAAVKEQAELYSHTCFGLFGYESYLRLAEQPQRTGAGGLPQAHLLHELGRRGRRERRQDRPLRHQAQVDHRLRRRVPRPYLHDPEPDLPGGPLQDGLRPLRSRGLPRSPTPTATAAR